MARTTSTAFRGFNNGLKQVKMGDYQACLEELREALRQRSRTGFYLYQYGKYEPKASQAAAITAIFAKYGVTENIWGPCD